MRVDAFCRSDIRASPPPPRRGWMAPPRRVLAGCFGRSRAGRGVSAGPREQPTSPQCCGLQHNRQPPPALAQRQKESEGLRYRVPVTEDAIKMAGDKLKVVPLVARRGGSPVAAAAAAARCSSDVGGFDPGRPSPEFVLFIVEILSKFVLAFEPIGSPTWVVRVALRGFLGGDLRTAHRRGCVRD